jgi:hypothetical protein
VIRKLLAGLALAAVAGATHAATINFDDGSAGSAVGSFYSGVTFSANTFWTSNEGLPGSSGLLGIDTNNPDPFIFGPDTPVVATFDTPTNHVKITGVDVGDAGLEIDAYDASNTLIGSNQVFGTGLGINSFFDVFVDLPLPNIASVHIFQPGSLGDSNPDSEGIILDNFEFSGGVPEPATWVMMIAGFGLAGAALRRRAIQAA